MGGTWLLAVLGPGWNVDRDWEEPMGPFSHLAIMLKLPNGILGFHLIY